MSTQTGLTAQDRRKSSPGNDVLTGLPGSRFQNVTLTEIISEGEVEGLVEGGSSIFLNDDPMFEPGEAPFTPSTSVTGTGATNSTSVTLSASTRQTIEEEDGKLFVGVEVIEARVTFSNKTYAVTGAAIYNTTSGFGGTMTASSNIFHADMVHVPGAYGNISLENLAHGDATVELEIQSSGQKIYGFIDSFTSATVASFSSNKVTAIDDYLTDDDFAVGNSHKIIITVYYEVSALSGTSVTLSSNPTVAFTNKRVMFQGPKLSSDLPTNQKYPGSSYQFRTGTELQDPLSNINGQGNTSAPLTTPGGSLLKNVSQTITSSALSAGQKAEVDEVSFLIAYPQGLYGYDESNGDEYITGVGYRVEVGINRGSGFTFASVGGNTGPGQRVSGIGTSTETIYSHSTLAKASITVELNVDLTPFQPFTDFSIRVTRLTNHGTVDSGVDYQKPHRALGHAEGSLAVFPNEEKWKGVLTASISSATAIIKEKLNFPHTSLASISFNSKVFQGLPKRSYEVKGIKVLVPSNYETRDENVDESTYPGKVATYTRNVSTGVIESTNQAWDGNFRSSKIYTDNPAWVFFDILTNNRYGLGEYLQSLDIDKFALYRIGRYCDELVPDGKGSKEPRFTANLYLTKATDAYKVLKDIATIFRGMLYWMDGLITPVMDEAKEPVYQFSKSNVIDGAFQYESTGSKTRANQYIIEWNNPESQYKLEPLIVEDRQNIIRTGKIIKEKAIAFGCTSEGQAIRYGRWKLWTAINQTEVVSFETGINAAFLAAGDIINISDSDDFNIPFSGRVNSYTESGGNFLTLDRDIDAFLPTSGYSYTVSVIIPKNVAVLNQDSATVNGASLTRGDIVTTARVASGGSQATLVVSSEDTTNLNISNALDDSNNSIELLLNTSTIVQEESLTGTATVDGTVVQVPAAAVDGKTKIQLSSALDENNASDLSGAIWAVKQTDSAGAKSKSSPKQYKILGIGQEGEDGIYQIVAVEHYNAKFDSIEEDFRLAVADTVSPIEPGTGVPRPKNLRILKRSDANRTGEEISIQWDAPDNYEFTKEFLVTHDITIDKKVVQERTDKRILNLNGVRDGVYQVQVQAVSELNKRSRPITQNVEIKDIFGGPPRKRGVMLGGLCSSGMDIDRTNGKVFFIKDSYRIAPPANTQGAISDGSTANLVRFNDSSNASSISQSIAGLANGSYPGFINADGAAVGQIFYDYSNAEHSSNDPLRLIAYKRDATLDVDYYVDADKFLADANSVWTNLSGTVAVTAGSNKVVGTNTSFTSFDVTRVLKFSSTQAAKIAFIESDTVLYLDRSFTAAVNAGTTAAIDELGINFAEDFILGEVLYNGNLSAGQRYNFIPEFTKGDLLADNSRAVIATPNVMSLMYGSDGAVKTDFDSITLKVQTVGFEAPKIKVNGAGFDQTDQTAQTSFSAIASEPHSVTLHSAANDGANAITFAGGALVFTVTIQETEDTTITATETVTITKAQEESASGATRTASGYLYYNTQQANAPSAPSASGVNYVWNTGLMNSGVIGAGATQWNQIAPTPTAGTSSSKMWYVYYNVVQASSSDASSTPTFGTAVYAATNFTGLVRFTSTGSNPSVEDGSGGSLSFGAGGSTLIDGGNIQTGVIRSYDSSGAGATNNAAQLNGSDFTTTGTIINLLDGAISSKNFRIASNGSAEFKGTVKIGTVPLDATNTLNTNTTKDNVGLPNVEDGTPAQQVQAAFTPGTTVISGGKITLSSESAAGGTTSVVELNSATKQILIKDAGVTRVLIGKLT